MMSTDSLSNKLLRLAESADGQLELSRQLLLLSDKLGIELYDPGKGQCVDKMLAKIERQLQVHETLQEAEQIYRTVAFPVTGQDDFGSQENREKIERASALCTELLRHDQIDETNAHVVARVETLQANIQRWQKEQERQVAFKQWIAFEQSVEKYYQQLSSVAFDPLQTELVKLKSHQSELAFPWESAGKRVLERIENIIARTQETNKLDQEEKKWLSFKHQVEAFYKLVPTSIFSELQTEWQSLSIQQEMLALPWKNAAVQILAQAKSVIDQVQKAQEQNKALAEWLRFEKEVTTFYQHLSTSTSDTSKLRLAKLQGRRQDLSPSWQETANQVLRQASATIDLQVEIEQHRMELGVWRAFISKVNAYQNLTPEQMAVEKPSLREEKNRLPLTWQDSAEQAWEQIERAEQLEQWREFSKLAVSFARLVPRLLTKGSDTEAKHIVEMAKKAIETWPDTDEEPSSFKTAAKNVHSAMALQLDEGKKQYFDICIHEAGSWIGLANQYVPIGVETRESSNQNLEKDPFSALSCLSRAEAILKVLSQDSTLDVRRKEKALQGQDQIRRFQRQVKEHLSKWLSQKRQKQHLQAHYDLQRELNNSAANTPAEFLAEKQQNRELVDRIRLYFYMDPEYKPSFSPEPSPVSKLGLEPTELLQALIMTRQENLFQARQLLHIVKYHWPESSEQKPVSSYTHWAWSRINMAHECDPDNDEISKLYTEISREQAKMSQEFIDALNQFEHRIALANQEIQRDIASNPDLHKSMEEQVRYLQECLQTAQDIYKRQTDKPQDWHQRITAKSFQFDMCHKAYTLGQSWDVDVPDWPRLVVESKILLGDRLPAFARLYLGRVIKQKEPSHPVKASLAIEHSQLVDACFASISSLS
jgi:hypothetical protein